MATATAGVNATANANATGISSSNGSGNGTGARIRGANYIGGRWTPAGSAAFPSINPARTDDTVGEFPASGKAEADAAVAAALEAFPKWRAESRIRRGECFDRLAQLIKRDVEPLTELVAREAGKQVNEARADVIEALHMCQYVFGTVRMSHGDVLDSEIPGKECFVRRKPKGVVAVITPWNFPFAIPIWMLGPSLVEGNTCVLKPSEDTPAIGQRLVEMMIEAGFPPGTVNLLHGGAEAGQPLCENPDVRVICFTGSGSVGQKLRMVAASQPGKIIAAEMGSKSAVIVCDDARLDLAVNAAVLSAFKSAGQRCVSAGRVLVHERVLKDFTEKFTAVARRVRFGDPFDPNAFAGPLINSESVERVLSYNDLARKEGAQVLLDGGRPAEDGLKRGYFLHPFAYRIEHAPGLRSIREEVFGPHVAIIPFKDLDHAIEIYNDTEYGLSVSVITEDYRKMREVRERCEFGLGYCNLPCIGAEVHLPFGGVKRSGSGIPSASGLIEAVTDKIAWTVNYDTTFQMAQGLRAEV
jgi:aldehyde dehydrogenase (NAD+)